MTERLVRRRTHAEFLAEQNARLFSEQRSVAQTLQHSLLPEQLPDFDGLELAVRYVPGVDGVEIGGDWYDVIGRDNGDIIFVVGDVSGRGLRAATVMASLRYAIRAYAAQGDDPAIILAKLAKLIDIVRDGHFATGSRFFPPVPPLRSMVGSGSSSSCASSHSSITRSATLTNAWDAAEDASACSTGVPLSAHSRTSGSTRQSSARWR